MKRILISMIILPLAVMACLTGCSKDNDVTPVIPEPDPDPVEEPVKTAEELLKDIPGVTILQTTKDKNDEDITVFNYEQPIDHTDPSAGTFQQYCVLHYKGPDHVTVLCTRGYSIAEPKYFKRLDLAKNLDANFIEVEHRYYEHSLINFEEKVTDCTGDYWKYNTAAQSTADLHAVVTALKGTDCFKNKWLSMGTSKSGMLTALYAYYYPNDMDAYVPFCAPFCTAAESDGIGKWLTQKSDMVNGLETETHMQVWSIFDRLLYDEDFRRAITDFDNKERNANRTVDASVSYVLSRFMANMFYKYCYYKPEHWADVIPTDDYPYSAEVYYRFIMLGGKDYWKKLNELRQLMGKEEIESEEADDGDDYDYMIGDEWDELNEDDEMAAGSRRVAPRTLTKDRLMEVIYFVQASKELGYFLYDWTWLPDNYPEYYRKWLEKYRSITSYNKTYGMEYDGGKLMNDFLAFVKNNRNKDKCKMLFIYGGNDPWSGAAIPDPDPDDPCVKKHMVPNGVHSDDLNDPEDYTEEEKNWIMNAVREMLQ